MIHRGKGKDTKCVCKGQVLLGVTYFYPANTIKPMIDDTGRT